MYNILMGARVIGQAEVIKEGLYYRFSCKCTPPDAGMYRIVVSDGCNKKDLGICVPTGERFCLVSRVPVKYLPGENLEFSLVSNEKRIAVPVKNDMPFPALDKLETAYLQENGENTEIIIDPVQDRQDSGQSQESLHKWERL